MRGQAWCSKTRKKVQTRTEKAIRQALAARLISCPWAWRKFSPWTRQRVPPLVI